MTPVGQSISIKKLKIKKNIYFTNMNTSKDIDYLVRFKTKNYLNRKHDNCN